MTELHRYGYAGYRDVDAIVLEHGDALEAIVSIGSPPVAAGLSRPSGIPSDAPPAAQQWARRLQRPLLRLEFDDIRLEHSTTDVLLIGGGRSIPFSTEHAQALFELGHNLRGPVLVHCAMGLARSPGCAFLLAAQALGPGREDEAATAIQSYGRLSGCPNTMVVRVGDEVLGRGGALLRAWERHWNLGAPFAWNQ